MSLATMRKITKAQKQISLVVVLLAVATAGVLFLVISHAASPYAAQEAETGTLTHGSYQKTLPSASSQSYVQFNGVGAKVFDFTLSSGNIMANGTITAKAQAVLDNPNIDGVDWQFNWSDLEPSKGTFDFSEITDAINADIAAGKLTLLRIQGGVHAPSWVYTDGTQSITVNCSDLSDCPNGFTSQPMPVPWDSTFISDWGTLIQHLGTQFNGNSNVYVMEMTGWGWIGEMVLPQKSTTIREQFYADATADHYANFDAAYIDAVEQITGKWRTAFPNTHTGIAIGEPLGTGSTTCPTDPSQVASNECASDVLPTLIPYLTDNYPNQVFVQQNGLGSGTNYFKAMETYIQSAFHSTTVGYQFAGNSACAQRANGGFNTAINDHASYVEVYTNDINNYPSSVQNLRNGTISTDTDTTAPGC